MALLAPLVAFVLIAAEPSTSKHEPRRFLGLLETQYEEGYVAGFKVRLKTEVMPATPEYYQDMKRRGQVTEEMATGGMSYFATEGVRDIRMAADKAALFTVVERYKCESPLSAADFEAQFTANVKSIESAGGATAKIATPIGVDPRWFIELDVQSIEKPGGRLDAKGPLTLMVRRPAHLFTEDYAKAIGKVYRFTIYGSTVDGQPRYGHVEARAADDASTAPSQ